MGRDPARLVGSAREGSLRRGLQGALLSLALLPPLGMVAAALVERVLVGADRATGPPYVVLAVGALAAAGVAVASARRIAARLATLEEREARFRRAFEAAGLAASLAEGAWLSRLEEEERRVSERAADWREENAELEGFAYAVSHDLRAPLRHLDAFVSLLRRRTTGTLDPEGEHCLDAIAGAAEKMGTLVDDLLSFLRMRHAELVRAPVDVAALVRELIAELGPQTAGREVEWKIGELPPIEADRWLLRAALGNLLSNAVKFTRPRPRAAIEIGGSVTPGGDEVTLYVRDSGVGFDPRYAGKLFEVFQRLHRADEFEGTGIGLAMVRRIVERHGGNVWAEGEPGQGATFFLSFPRGGRVTPAPPAARRPPRGA